MRQQGAAGIGGRMVSVGSIVSGAFRLLRERPLAAIVWGFIYMAVSVGVGYATTPYYQAGRVGAAPPLSVFGMLMLFNLLLFLVMTVLLTASQRAVLRPRDDVAFHIRLGKDELRMISLAFLFAILFYLGMTILVVAMIAAFAAAGLASGSSASLIAPMIIAFLAVFALATWFGVRLSLSYPLTLLREKFVVGESWRLTRGRFWTLFGGYLVIFLFLAVIAISVGLVVAGPYYADLLSRGFNQASVEAASQRQLAEQFGEITAMTVLGWVATTLYGTLFITLGGGAVATAAKELATDQNALAREFE